MKISSLMLVATLLILAQPTTVNAQNRASGKQLYFEMGGPGMLMSLNFDSRFKPGNRIGPGYRVGIGAIPVGGDNSYGNNESTSINFPVVLNYVLGKPNSDHAFEVGAGVTIFTEKIHFAYPGNYNGSYVVGHASFMYRRVPIDGGFTWRIGFTPLINGNIDVLPFFAFGLGYAF